MFSLDEHEKGFKTSWSDQLPLNIVPQRDPKHLQQS